MNARSRSGGDIAASSFSNSSVSTNNSTYFTVPSSVTGDGRWWSWSRRGVLHHLLHPAHHLVRGDVLDVGRDGPVVAEGVDDVAVAVAVELVGSRALDLGA